MDSLAADGLTPPIIPAAPATTSIVVPVGRTSAPAFAIATLLTGLAAGLAGMSLALLLHAIQHIAYGYSLHAVIGPESFLQGVRGVTPWHRFAVLAACGLVAGAGWWLVYRFGRPLVSIRAAVARPDIRMPAIATTGHALLQIVTVALGSPLGREVAPREIGTLLGGGLARSLRLSPEQTRIMLACGAGAGLAAVYNVPLGGALFTMEVLLGSFAPQVAIPALASSAIAAYVAWIGLGDETQYTLPPLGISLSLILWSALFGPVIGCGGWLYAKLAQWARARAPHDARIIPSCLLAFSAIGLMSMAVPELLGNGKGPIQLGLDGALAPRLAVALLALKLLSTTISLRAGAEGGLLTPGMTIGALLGLALGDLANAVDPAPIAPGAFALVGAAAFLAVSMRMPVTAIVLAFEFTHAGHDFLIPVILAVAGATAMSRICEASAGK